VCARSEDGTVCCWGSNYAGSVGDGTTTDRLTPTLVEGL
jgi:alpha-tubulin suppressor-like RCC1 family protein